MADAKQCDRCKQFYTLNPTRDYKIMRVSTWSVPLDLCPDCYLKLLQFIGVKPTEEEKKKGKKR